MYWKDDGVLQERANKLINEHFTHLKNCRICYLNSNKEKKSKGFYTHADTEKVNEKMKLLTGYDFIITFYEPNNIGMSEKALEILMYHELMHVGYEPENEECYIVPHDLQDFRKIVNEFGTDWTLTE